MHRFPGPNILTEGHLFLPFPALCYPKAYLTMWAILGRRSPDQRALTRGQTLAPNIRFMAKVNAPCKAENAVAKLGDLQFIAEGSERMRRSQEPYRRKKIVLERVQNVAKSKTPGSISCE